MLLETTCYHMYGYKSLLPNGNKTLYSWDSIMVPKWSTADNKRDPKYLWNTVLFTELSQTCSSLLNGSHTGQIPAWSQEQPAKQPATHFCWVLSEFLAGLGRIPNLSASGSSQAPGIWTAADSLSNKSTVRSSWEVEIRISLRWSLPHLADCTSLHITCCLWAEVDSTGAINRTQLGWKHPGVTRQRAKLCKDLSLSLTV